jgi:hypothetical protein
MTDAASSPPGPPAPEGIDHSISNDQDSPKSEGRTDAPDTAASDKSPPAGGASTTGSRRAPPDNRPKAKDAGTSGKRSEDAPSLLDPTQVVDRERLLYIEAGRDGDRLRYPHEPHDRFDFLRTRLDEILARYEASPVIILGVRHEAGLPWKIMDGRNTGNLFVRGDQSTWGALKHSTFDDLWLSFADATQDHAGEAVFLDWIPYSELSGDVERLVGGRFLGGARNEQMELFEERLRERRFRFLLIVAIDKLIDTSVVCTLYPSMQLLPWTDLWLTQFVSSRNLSMPLLWAKIGDDLRTAGTWQDNKDDGRENVLNFELQNLSGDRDCDTLDRAIAGIRAALELANSETPELSSRACREELTHYIAGKPDQDGASDPIKQTMLTVAAFAGGTRVDQYYEVCRALLPDDDVGTKRLPLALQEKIARDAEDARRLRRESGVRPGWDVVFDKERDYALNMLQIRVVDGQMIRLGSRWRPLDLKREIARGHPGLIITIMERISRRRLLLVLPELEQGVLLKLICAIRDACGDGFDDQGLAFALSGAQDGLGTPLDIVRQLYPGHDPEAVLNLLADIQGHRNVARSLAAVGETDPERDRFLRALEEFVPGVTPENFDEKFADLIAQLRERSARRLTRHILRMRTASNSASEARRPIITSMLGHLESLLPTETYIAMLTYIIATSSEISSEQVGGLLQREIARATNIEVALIIAALRDRLRQALAWANAPHKNWLVAFDPLRPGKAADDRIRAVAVLVWDTAINEDVRWRIMPYDQMRHLRLVCRLFGKSPNLVDQRDTLEALADSNAIDEKLIELVAVRFFRQQPIDWLNALSSADDMRGSAFSITVANRIADIVWVVMTGAAESEYEKLQAESPSIANDVLASLTSALKGGSETDVIAAALNVIEARETPADRFNRRWLQLYGLFWPAMLAHWRFAAFGLGPFQIGSEDERHYLLLLNAIVDTPEPQRFAEYRDGFEILAKAAEKCAARALSLRAPQSARLYRLKADRLLGLRNFFSKHASSPLMVIEQTEDR